MLKSSNQAQNGMTANVAFGVLILLLIGSLVFYKLRMLFADPSWVLFNIINTGTFAISEHRYTAIFTQIVPLLGVKIGLGIKALLVSYSASFYVLYSVISWICWKKYGQGQWVLLLAMYFTLGVSDVYFWPNNEVHQGIAWMALYMSFFTFHLEQNTFNFWRQFVAVVFIFLALFGHLLVIIPFVYFFLYLFSSYYNDRVKGKLVYGQLAAIVLIFSIKLYLSYNGWYDGEKLQGLSGFSLQKLIPAFTEGHVQSISALFLNNYQELTLLFIVGIAYLLYKKLYLMAVFTICFVFLYSTAVFITYHEAFDRSLRFYFESEWNGLTLILVTPFVFKILPRIQAFWSVAILLTVFLCRLPTLHDSYHLFKKRYENLGRIIEKPGPPNRLLSMTSSESQELFMIPWGLPIETMLLSKMNGDVTVRTVKNVPPEFVDTCNTKIDYYSCFKIDQKANLNPRYFQLSDEGYQLIEQ